MRATLTDEAVIFDSLVAAYFGVRAEPLQGDPPDWLEILLDRYGQIERGIQTFVQQPKWPQFQSHFDQAFPDAAHLPAIRKADLLVWAHMAA